MQRNSSNGNVVGVQNNNGNSGSSNIQITTNKYKNPKNVAYRIENNRSIISLQKNKKSKQSWKV